MSRYSSLRYFLLCILIFCFHVDRVFCTFETVISVTPTNDATTNFPNPSRGFYAHWGTRCKNTTLCHDWKPVTERGLDWYRQHKSITVHYRIWHLQSYRNVSLFEPQILERIESDFQAARNARVKLMIRFSYASEIENYIAGRASPPWGDADLPIVLSHIAQLKPIIQRNLDVLLSMQAGFIGVWGENFFTDYYVSNSSRCASIDAESYGKRYQVYAALLDALPEPIQLQLRYPYQLDLLGLSDAQKKRMGVHNDCFLATHNGQSSGIPNDMGTYSQDNETRASQRLWLEEASKTRMIGGETCAVNPPYSDCPNALSELARFHWTSLNSGYQPNVISRLAPCIDTIKLRLGYRLRFAKFDLYLNQLDQQYYVSFVIVNDGYAAPLLRYRIVVTFESDERTLSAQLEDIDATSWLPDESGHAIDRALLVFNDEADEEDDYRVYVSLIDPLNSNYTIRLAHSGESFLYNIFSGRNALIGNETIRARIVKKPTFAPAIVVASVVGVLVLGFLIWLAAFIFSARQRRRHMLPALGDDRRNSSSRRSSKTRSRSGNSGGRSNSSSFVYRRSRQNSTANKIRLPPSSRSREGTITTSNPIEV